MLLAGNEGERLRGGEKEGWSGAERDGKGCSVGERERERYGVVFREGGEGWSCREGHSVGWHQSQRHQSQRLWGVVVVLGAEVQ